jgi:hypothetical protein
MINYVLAQNAKKLTISQLVTRKKFRKKLKLTSTAKLARKELHTRKQKSKTTIAKQFAVFVFCGKM